MCYRFKVAGLVYLWYGAKPKLKNNLEDVAGDWMHLESHHDMGEPQISEIRFNDEELFIEANETIHSELDEKLDRILNVFNDEGEDLVLLDRRETETSRADRKEREVNIMAKVDTIFKRIQSSGIDTNSRIDEELQTLAKRLVLLIDRQRIRLDFPPLSAASLIQMVYEIWYTDDLHGHRKRQSGTVYSRDHLMGALQNLIAYTGLTGVSTAIATLRHDDYEDLEIHQEEQKPELLLADKHYKDLLELLLPPGIMQGRLSNLRERVRGLVHAVTNLKAETGIDKKITEADSFRRFLQSMGGGAGPRVAYVRLAERLHNVDTISFVPNPEKRTAKLKETADIHVPMAGLLHLDAIRRALLESCFETQNLPALDGFRAIQEQRLYDHLGPEEARLEAPLCKDLAPLKEDPHIRFIGLVPCHFADYADPHQLLNEHYVPEVDDWDPMFEVYIETEEPEEIRAVVLKVMSMLEYPASRYPRIKTIGDKGTRIDLMSDVYNGRVQIRVNDQRSEARRIRGFLPSGDEETSPIISRGIERVLAATKEKVEAVFDVAEAILLKPTIRVFTPKPEEITLLSGATALDFAAAIHTDMPAKVTRVVRRRYPEDKGQEIHILTPLREDDIIEIITDKDARPDLGWYNFVQGHAHDSLRRSYRTLSDEERMTEGSKYLGTLANLLGIHEQHSVFRALTLLDLPAHLKQGLERHETLERALQGFEEEASKSPLGVQGLDVKIATVRQSLSELEKSLLTDQKNPTLKRIFQGRLNPLEFFANNVDFSDGLEVEISMPNVPGMASKATDFFAKAGINLIASGQERSEEPGKELLVLKIQPFGEVTTPHDVLKVLLRLNYEYPVRVRSNQFRDFVAKSLPGWASDITHF